MSGHRPVRRRGHCRGGRRLRGDPVAAGVERIAGSVCSVAVWIVLPSSRPGRGGLHVDSELCRKNSSREQVN